MIQDFNGNCYECLQSANGKIDESCAEYTATVVGRQLSVCDELLTLTRDCRRAFALAGTAEAADNLLLEPERTDWRCWMC